MMSEKEILKLKRASERELKKAEKLMAKAPINSVAYKTNRDIKLMSIAEIDMLNKVLKGS